MTFRYKGKTLTDLHRSFAKKADWTKKLARNAGPKLNRLAGLVELTPASLNTVGKIKLRYVGEPTDLEKNLNRIQKVLSATFVDNQASVQFKRITVPVTLELPNAA